VPHGPADVALDQVDDLGGGGGETQDAQLVIHKDRGDAGAGQQVVHVVVGPDQVGEDALAVRGQMLHQDKGHARISVCGHAGKEGLKRRQAPGRSPMPTMGKPASGFATEASALDLFFVVMKVFPLK
jgi:hypothetical protein